MNFTGIDGVDLSAVVGEAPAERERGMVSNILMMRYRNVYDY
jgi:hypothetical protein